MEVAYGTVSVASCFRVRRNGDDPLPRDGSPDWRPGTMIQEKLVSQIKVTKAAADHSDIVTAGDVVVLHKDGLMMCSSASSYAFSNTYSNGVLAANYNNRAKDAAKSFFKGPSSLWRWRQRHRRCKQRLHFAKVCRRREVLDYRRRAAEGRDSRQHLQRPLRMLAIRSATTEKSSFHSRRAACRRQTISSKLFQS